MARTGNLDSIGRLIAREMRAPLKPDVWICPYCNLVVDRSVKAKHLGFHGKA